MGRVWNIRRLTDKSMSRRILCKDNSVQSINASLIEIGRQGQDLESLANKLISDLQAQGISIETDVKSSLQSKGNELETSLNTSVEEGSNLINAAVNNGITEIQNKINQGILDLNMLYATLSSELINLANSLKSLIS